MSNGLASRQQPILKSRCVSMHGHPPNGEAFIMNTQSEALESCFRPRAVKMSGTSVDLTRATKISVKSHGKPTSNFTYFSLNNLKGVSKSF